METIQEQIGALQEEIKQLRKELEVVKKGNFDKITCKGCYVVDEDGKPRIMALTLCNGVATVNWIDTNGKTRISASTRDDGEASVNWIDEDGNKRISAATFANEAASVLWKDKDGNTKITAATLPNGDARLFDDVGKTRIGATTLACKWCGNQTNAARDDEFCSSKCSTTSGAIGYIKFLLGCAAGIYLLLRIFGR